MEYQKNYHMIKALSLFNMHGRHKEKVELQFHGHGPKLYFLNIPVQSASMLS